MADRNAFANGRGRRVGARCSGGFRSPVDDTVFERDERPTGGNDATSAPTPQSSASAAPSPSASTAASPAATAATYTGTSIGTRYGNVQVQITVTDGKLTDVTALQLTSDGGRSVQISNEAAPILRKEVLAAQSANVDSVSGATYTSDGYLSSLQSALDKAGL